MTRQLKSFKDAFEFMSGLNGKTCLCLEMPLIEYRVALDLQHQLVAARQTNVLEKDMVLLLEHPPVFTIGRRGGIENLKVSTDFLERKKIPVIPVERGGDITFHGPGQLVIYPIIDLTKAGLKVLDYVVGLEEVMLRTVSTWKIPAERNSANRGIWVAGKKLGSVGISIKKGVSFHGVALNVNPSLRPFKWIHPCGLTNVGVTSMARELSKNISMSPIKEAVMYHLETVFGFNLFSIDFNDMNHILKRYPVKDNSMKLSKST